LSIISLALGNRNKREENLAHASHAVQDMKAIIDRCVTADQVGGLSLTQQRKTVDVVQLIRQQASTMPLLESRLHLMTANELPMLQTDEQLLQIILTNLLDNAAHYSDPLMPVIVELTQQKQAHQAGLCARVRNVPGLAGWPDAEQIFSKYYRASGAQRESGSGLGLYLSRQLAKSLRGSLTYEPHSQYVEFVLWIPLHPA
jgi:K+-sensing histidine kinase KdpD